MQQMQKTLSREHTCATKEFERLNFHQRTGHSHGRSAIFSMVLMVCNVRSLTGLAEPPHDVLHQLIVAKQAMQQGKINSFTIEFDGTTANGLLQLPDS